VPVLGNRHHTYHSHRHDWYTLLLVKSTTDSVTLYVISVRGSVVNHQPGLVMVGTGKCPCSCLWLVFIPSSHCHQVMSRPPVLVLVYMASTGVIDAASCYCMAEPRQYLLYYLVEYINSEVCWRGFQHTVVQHTAVDFAYFE